MNRPLKGKTLGLAISRNDPPVSRKTRQRLWSHHDDMVVGARVRMFLTGNSSIEGTIEAIDNWSVRIQPAESGFKPQIIFKHAIETVVLL